MSWLDTNLRNPALRSVANRLTSELRLDGYCTDAIEMLLANFQQAGQERLTYRRAAHAYELGRYQRFERHHVLSPLWRMRGRYTGESQATKGHAPSAQAMPLLQTRLARIETTAVFAEPIVLRSEKVWNEERSTRMATGIDYDDTEETIRMRDELCRYNAAMAAHRVVDAAGRRHTTHLVRIFSQGSFDKGGRFYRASYQQLPKAERAQLTIDVEPVVELDFCSMHPTMLYLRAGLEPPEDAYAKADFDREMLKRAFNVALNASDIRGAKRATANAFAEAGHLEADAHAQGYVDDLPKLYPQLADRFFSGEGLHLQRLDSEIAAHVMNRCVESGVAVLVMHDSFLVRRRHEIELRKIMISEFQAVLDTNYTPVIR